MTDFEGLLKTLTRGNVDFILVGGAAATAHGSSRLTQDIDIVYSRSPDNLQRLVDSLQPYSPYLRGAPPGLPFKFDSVTLQRGLNFTLTTTLGDIDILGEIPGGTYGELRPFTVSLIIFGAECLCLKLSKLIEVKRAAGRPKDFDAIAELESMLEELQENGG